MLHTWVSACPWKANRPTRMKGDVIFVCVLQEQADMNQWQEMSWLAKTIS